MPAAAAGLLGSTYSTTNPSPLDNPSCSLTTVGTCDVSTPRKIMGTLGIFSWPPGGMGCGCPGGCGSTGGVCANPAIGRRATVAMIVMNLIFMGLVWLNRFGFLLLMLVLVVVRAFALAVEQEQEQKQKYQRKVH